MSGKVVGWAFEQKCSSLAAKLILVKLADNANEEGLCWPSVRLIVKHTGLTDRAVRQNLHLLERDGIIVISPRVVGGRQCSNAYQLCMSKAAEDTPSSAPAQHASPAQETGGEACCQSTSPSGSQTEPPSPSEDEPRTIIQLAKNLPPVTLIGGDTAMKLRMEAFRRMLLVPIFDAWFKGSKIYAGTATKPTTFILPSRFYAKEVTNRFRLRMERLFGEDCEITCDEDQKPSENETSC